MDNMAELNEARTSLCNQIDHEIMTLKVFMEEVKEEDFKGNPEKTADVCERIVYAAEGLKKLASVLSFIDCWEDNGDIPQISRRASFRKE